MAVGVLIALLGNQNGGLNLPRTDVHRAGLDIELPDGLPADAVGAGELHDGLIGVEGGGGVGRGDAVAGVAADGADVADLGSAHLVHRLAQHVDVLLDQRVFGDVGKAGEGADTQRAVGLQRDAPELIQAEDGDELCAGPLPLPHLHQHVGSAGDDLGLGMGQTEGHGVLDAFCLIEGFHIIHGGLPPLSPGSARPL